MEAQHKPMDREGQPLCVGLDVHLKSWTVTIRGAGTELAHFNAPPDAGALATHLRRRYPGAVYRSVYEAGFCGFAPHRALEQQGIHNLVVHSPDVPTTHKEKLAKEDHRDSRLHAGGAKCRRAWRCRTRDTGIAPMNPAP